MIGRKITTDTSSLCIKIDLEFNFAFFKNLLKQQINNNKPINISILRNKTSNIELDPDAKYAHWSDYV